MGVICAPCGHGTVQKARAIKKSISFRVLHSFCFVLFLPFFQFLCGLCKKKKKKKNLGIETLDRMVDNITMISLFYEPWYTNAVLKGILKRLSFRMCVIAVYVYLFCFYFGIEFVGLTLVFHIIYKKHFKVCLDLWQCLTILR